MRAKFGEVSKAAKPRTEVAVVGTGAIGRSLAAMLCRAGHDAGLYGRDESARKLRDAPFLFKSPDDDAPVTVDVPVTGYGEAAGDHPPKVIFYATKASYLGEALRQTRHMIGPDTTVVFLQGGIQWWFGRKAGAEMSTVTDPAGFGDMIPEKNIYAGLISFGAEISKEPPHAATLNSKSPIVFGPLHGTDETDAQAEALKALFDPCPVDAGTTKELHAHMWTKAAGSFGMSAYALITGKTLGEMTDDPDILQGMVAAAEVFRAAGEKMGIANNTDYAAYFRKIAGSKPHHMMSITKDPAEYTEIIERPLQIAEKLGIDVGALRPVAAQARIGADKIIAAMASPAAKPKAAGFRHSSFR